VKKIVVIGTRRMGRAFATAFTVSQADLEDLNRRIDQTRGDLQGCHGQTKSGNP
jgi:hypothetical protein